MVGTLADKRDVSTTLTMVGGKLVSSSGGRMFIGTNTVTFTATDTFQNTGTCTREVEVLDCAPPLVVCKDITAETVRSRAFTIMLYSMSIAANIMHAGVCISAAVCLPFVPSI